MKRWGRNVIPGTFTDHGLTFLEVGFKSTNGLSVSSVSLWPAMVTVLPDYGIDSNTPLSRFFLTLSHLKCRPFIAM
jgi:hypothetical protein